MINKYKFPEGFLWGSGTASEQIEPNGPSNIGNQAQSNWQKHFEDNIDKYFESNFCLNDFWNRYEEDLEIAKNLNFNSLRLSISWSRLLPDGKNVDTEAAEKYREIFKTAIDKGIRLVINLAHFEMPQFILEDGGYSSRNIHQWYRNYARAAFENFGDLAEYWSAFNESFNVSMAVHLLGVHPNSKEHVSFEHTIRSIWHFAVCTAIAVEEFKKAGLSEKAKIGSVFVGSKAIARSDSEEDQEALRIADLLLYRAFYDPALIGKFPQELIDFLESNNAWPSDLIQPGDEELIANNTIDFVGVNFYQVKRIQADNEEHTESEFGPTSVIGRSIFPQDLGFKLFKFWSNPNGRINRSRGQEIYPEALYLRLKEIKELYGDVPIMITENGIGIQDEGLYRKDGVIQDTYRVHHMSEHLYWIHKAIEEGVNVFGYQMWTYIDNWSWTNAYKNRYGFIELDINTRERKDKLSASWIREVIANNTLEFDDELIGAEIEFKKYN